MKKVIFYIVLVSIFIACNDTQKPSDANNQNSPDETEESLQKKFEDGNFDNLSKELAKGNNQFAIDFYNTLEQNDENIMFSPLSIYTALGMLHEGADKNTAQELNKVLHLAENNYQNPEAFYNLLGIIYAYNYYETTNYDYDTDKEIKTKPYQINVANSIWVDDELKTEKSYKQNLQKNFEAQLFNVDLQKETTVNEINNWIKKETRETIPNIIAELDVNAKLVLLNALYFKAPWEEGFRKAKKKDFYLDNQQQVNVDMMYSDEHANRGFFEDNEVKVLQLDYEYDSSYDSKRPNRRFAMYCILPQQRNTLKKIEQTLSYSKLDSWLRQIESFPVVVELPKFKFGFEGLLNDYLQKLGLKEVFTSDANLSKISKSTQLIVSRVIHKTFISVDEKGTEASAVTLIETAEEAAMEFKEFIANHPFLFLIREEESGAIVFMGRVSNPTKE